MAPLIGMFLGALLITYVFTRILDRFLGKPDHRAKPASSAAIAGVLCMILYAVISSGDVGRAFIYLIAATVIAVARVVSPAKLPEKPSA